MRRTHVLALFVGILGILTIVLIPIAINIATGALPPWVNSWVKEHTFWVWIAIGLFGILAIILIIVSSIMNAQENSLISISKTSNTDLEDNESQNIQNLVEDVERKANNDPLFTQDWENYPIILDKWNLYTFTLINAYNRYTNSSEDKSPIAKKHTKDKVIENSVREKRMEDYFNLLERLIKAARRSFIFLHKEADFLDIAQPIYTIAFNRKKYILAAELAYNISRIYHDLKRPDQRNAWIEALRGCLYQSNLSIKYPDIFNDLQDDEIHALDIPHDTNLHKDFYQALLYSAKLFDLEGMNASSNDSAFIYFKKALKRAEKLPEQNQILHYWIQIHMSELEVRTGLKPIGRYNASLTFAKAQIPTDASYSAQYCDLIDLMLTCYSKLGYLALENRDIQTGLSQFEEQLTQAKKHGRSDFILTAHKGLAEAFFKLDPQDLQKASEHAILAWNVNQNFRQNGSNVIDLNKLIDVLIEIMRKSIAKNAQNASP